MGVSVEDRAHGLPRVDIVRDVPATVHFLSLEPLLEDIGRLDLEHIEWVIVGGESGPNARRMEPQWARNVRDQCRTACVPFFFKQWGEFDARGVRVGKKRAGRLLDGRRWEEMPGCAFTDRSDAAT